VAVDAAKDSPINLPKYFRPDHPMTLFAKAFPGILFCQMAGYGVADVGSDLALAPFFREERDKMMAPGYLGHMGKQGFLMVAGASIGGGFIRSGFNLAEGRTAANKIGWETDYAGARGFGLRAGTLLGALLMADLMEDGKLESLGSWGLNVANISAVALATSQMMKVVEVTRLAPALGKKSLGGIVLWPVLEFAELKLVAKLEQALVTDIHLADLRETIAGKIDTLAECARREDWNNWKKGNEAMAILLGEYTAIHTFSPLLLSQQREKEAKEDENMALRHASELENLARKKQEEFEGKAVFAGTSSVSTVPFVFHDAIADDKKRAGVMARFLSDDPFELRLQVAATLKQIIEES
ncbi:MAG: hypothetical protein Q7T03_08820, partial [Deltaproteobacteria bacterium]|nr:hypothetical protein [Deltaproteobacteria bacterium]